MSSQIFRRLVHSCGKATTLSLTNKFGGVTGGQITPSIRFLSGQAGDINFEELIKDKKVVVFMKGTPDAPRCGFSNAVCQILKFHGVNDFSSHDVLSNEDIRNGVKEFTNWPTIPQVFFNGEFIGGCDLLLEMHKNGELIEELQKIGIRSRLLDEDEESGKQT